MGRTIRVEDLGGVLGGLPPHPRVVTSGNSATPWTVLRELKADPRTREVPVIVVSMLDERPRGLASGAAEYLVKPVARDALLAALASVGVPGPEKDSRTGEEVTA